VVKPWLFLLISDSCNFTPISTDFYRLRQTLQSLSQIKDSQNEGNFIQAIESCEKFIFYIENNKHQCLNETNDCTGDFDKCYQAGKSCKRMYETFELAHWTNVKSLFGRFVPDSVLIEAA
jgi:hypothetical protein